MVSPSGHIYSKEAIFEYLLKKSKEIKEMEAIFNEQEVREGEREGEIDRTIAVLHNLHNCQVMQYAPSLSHKHRKRLTA